MTDVLLETIADVAPVEPAAQPVPVEPEQYQANTCPLCFGALQERRSGLWCPRDRGWLVEELREGRLVYVLWQGRL